MKLKLKEQYENATIIVGKTIVKTNNIKENHYHYYYTNGFSDYFDVIEAPKPIKYEGVEEKPKAKPKKKKKND